MSALTKVCQFKSCVAPDQRRVALIDNARLSPRYLPILTDLRCRVDLCRVAIKIRSRTSGNFPSCEAHVDEHAATPTRRRRTGTLGYFPTSPARCDEDVRTMIPLTELLSVRFGLVTERSACYPGRPSISARCWFADTACSLAGPPRACHSRTDGLSRSFPPSASVQIL
ncbi:hypothetical protein LSAT2_028877 [Lamellibrachia satsuma]|nr:hypothetical protein LSAT2_028877 [Lamellibrachia satsuma]